MVILITLKSRSKPAKPNLRTRISEYVSILVPCLNNNLRSFLLLKSRYHQLLVTTACKKSHVTFLTAVDCGTAGSEDLRIKKLEWLNDLAEQYLSKAAKNSNWWDFIKVSCIVLKRVIKDYLQCDYMI